MKKKLLFFLPAVLLTAITLFWLFYKDGRWYDYRSEWPFGPLLSLHLVMPLFYAVAGIVNLVMLLTKKKKGAVIFYLIASIIMTIVCFVELMAFIVFTSGM